MRIRAAKVGVGSPFALAFDSETNDIIAYTNLRVYPVHGRRSYGFLGAFALPASGANVPSPLWSRPLGLTETGRLLPNPGTFGQPALFRYETDNGEATGLIVNTVYTGTYLFK
jgi:hypothetical protein